MISRIIQALAVTVLLVASVYASPVVAQASVPPAHYATDERGVDLTTGGFYPYTTELVIGQPGAGGIAYGRSRQGAGWRDNLVGTVNSNGTGPGSRYTVSFGSYSDVFIAIGSSGSNFLPLTPNGSSLTYSAGFWIYTTSDGTVARFTVQWIGAASPYTANQGVISSITSPNGERTDFTYQYQLLCTRQYVGGPCRSGTIRPFFRLLSVSNNRGYQVRYEYYWNGDELINGNAFLRVKTVTGLNRGIDYCADNAITCTYSQTWPSVTYSDAPGSSDQLATDEMGRATRYRTDFSDRLAGITLPGSSSENTTVVYDGSGRVTSFTGADGAWTYAWSGAGPVAATVTGPAGQTFSTTGQSGILTSYTDANAQTTSYDYSSGSLDGIYYPDGSQTTYTRDARGNVIEERMSAPTGSGLADIVTTSVYPSTCTNVVVCNQPTSVTDARGFTTDYTYDSAHGGVLTITSPERTTGAPRPQTRFTYSAQYAWYKNSSGTIVQAPTPVTLPVQTSSCPGATSCVGGASEAVTSTTYGSAGVLNNLLPTSVTRRSGDSSVSVTATATWTSAGDTETTDGPLPGAADTTLYRYNANREVVGVVGPDPDGAGPLLNPAVRYTRSSVGQPTLVEQGTTPGYTGGDWSAFSALQQATFTYDFQGRPLRETMGDGTTVFSVIQTSYDSSGRPDCTATRMNPATFGSLPSSACASAIGGPFGPDRIRRAGYDTFGRLTSVTEGYGTAAAVVTSQTFDAMGRTATMTDGEGNLTTWTYDGFGRIDRMYYPVASGSGSSTTDYEALTYDAGSLPITRRRRDGTTVTLTYDNLGDLSAIDAPSGQDVAWTRDNLGRMLTATTTVVDAQTLTYNYDALGRLTSEGGPLGTVGYQFDAASRPTRITWPDAYFADYDYYVTGELQRVRENGATSGVGVLVAYGLDNLGRRVSLQRGNGVSSTYGYDGGSRLTSLALDLSGATQDVTFGFTYNPAGQVVTRSISNSAYAFGAPASQSVQYANDGLNRVTDVGISSIPYDGRGNITAADDGTWVFDLQSRVSSSNTTSFPIYSYGYDPSGRLFRLGGTSAYQRRFQYFGEQMIAEYDASGGLVQRYVPGAALDDYAAYSSGSGGTLTRQWPLPDQLGSVVGLTGATGNASQINTYDPYGVPASGNAGRFGYAGSLFVPGSPGAQHFMRNRAYSPSLGRFLQTDPIGISGGINLYAYASADPINLRDPSGLCTTPTSDCPVPDIPVTGERPDDPCRRPGVTCIGRDDIFMWQLTRQTMGGVCFAPYADPIAPVEPGPPQSRPWNPQNPGPQRPPSSPQAPPHTAPGLTVGGLLTWFLMEGHSDSVQYRTFYHYGYARDVGSMAGGLRARSYATDWPNYTAAGAQNYLSLRGPLRDTLYRVTVGPGVTVVGPRSVQPAYGMNGGGTEVYFPNGTPPGSVVPIRSLCRD